MIRINLLPPEERRPEIPYARVSLSFVGLFLLLLVIIYGVQCARIWSSEKALLTVRSRYIQLQPEREAMEQAADKQRQIEAKMVVVNQLVKTRTAPYNVVPRVAALMNENVWLDETKVNQNNDKVVELKGSTFAYEDLVQFVSRLEQDELFKTVILKSTEGDIKGGILKFTLEMKLKEI